MSITLIRHTAVAVEEGVCYGTADVPLCATFAQTAELLRSKLPPPPWQIISSPALRCRRLAESFGQDVIVDARLLELNFGSWELRRWNEIPRDEIDVWSADFVNHAPPGGESFAALAERAEACIAEAAKKHSEKNIVCVTHAGVIRALIAPRQGLTLRDAFNIRVDFGGFYLLPTIPQTGPDRHPLTTFIF